MKRIVATARETAKLDIPSAICVISALPHQNKCDVHFNKFTSIVKLKAILFLNEEMA